MYQLLMRPWVKFWTTELSAEIIRYLHPLRMQRYLFADINPLMRTIKNYAPIVRQNRKSASADNPFLAMEKEFFCTYRKHALTCIAITVILARNYCFDRLTATIGCSFSFRHLKQNRS